MIPKEVLLKSLFFDVESVGLYATFEELVSKNPKLAELWSKRCKWLRQNSPAQLFEPTDSQLWLEKSSLHPEFAKIVCVSIGAYNKENLNITSLIGDETDILKKTRIIFGNAASQNLRLAGHTIKNFDIPFLGKRMVINHIQPPELINFYNKKPWEMTTLDITDTFSFGAYGQAHTSLDLMCTVLGVESPKGDMEGSQVHEAFYKGSIEKIKIYCEKDVKAVVECFHKLSF